MEALGVEARRLMSESSAKSTWKAYKTGLTVFDAFRSDHSLIHVWPVPINHFVLFISFLSLSGRSLNTVRTYLAAINALHKLKNLPCSSSHFIIVKILEGFRRSNSPSSRKRSPITFPLLVKIHKVLEGVCYSNYEVNLFRAAFSLAFFALLRISEFAVSSKNAPTFKVLQVADITFHDSKPPIIEVKVRFSKTDQLGRGTILKIIADAVTPICPFNSLKRFVEQRGAHKGPLFCHFDKSPLSRCQVQAVLRKALANLGHDSSNYSTHSFRIGGATTAAQNNISERTLKVIGRWQSSAYKSYIQIPSRDICCTDLTI